MCWNSTEVVTTFEGDKNMSDLRTLFFLCCLFLAPAVAAESTLSSVPEPFRGHNPASIYTIGYADLNALLKVMVIDVGRSNREKAAPTQPKIGTKMKVNVKRSTINEGNRFFFEEFEDNEEYREMLQSIRDSLAEVPSVAPLEYFSRNEQLAYWLNLYNLTLLNEIVDIYPKRSLKKVLTGKKSVLAKKVLNVAGVPLSLDDIQHTILKQNYDSDPLVLYGLYQGIIGGPSIRKRAYTGENVRRLLALNAAEFINSNRGTYSDSETVFKVSSLYERNAAWFPAFDADLRTHLLAFLEGDERGELQAASKIKPNIDDWTVTDVYGTYWEPGGSVADNNAALLDSVKNSFVDNAQGGQLVSGNLSAASSGVQAKAVTLQRFSPQMLEYLYVIKEKEEATNLTKGVVTVEELGQAPVESQEPEQPEGNEE
jgi:hypothetical protein